MHCLKFQSQCFVLPTPVFLLACREKRCLREWFCQVCLLTCSVLFFPFVWIAMWGLVGQFSFPPRGSDPYVFSKALLWALSCLPFCSSHEFGVAEIFIACLRGRRYRVTLWSFIGLRPYFLILKTVLQTRMISSLYRESDQERFWLSSHILILNTYHTVSTATNSVEKINGRFSSKEGMLS